MSAETSSASEDDDDDGTDSQQARIGMIELADKNGRSRGKRRRFMERLPGRAKKMALLASIIILAGCVIFIRKRQLLRRVLSALYRLIGMLFNSFSGMR